MAAVAGKSFDAVQGGDDAALNAAFVNRLGAFEGAVDVHQHLLESGQVEPAQTGARSPDRYGRHASRR